MDNLSSNRNRGVVKICIVSDSHDRAPMLAAAVSAAKQDGAQAVVHCGDVIGAGTLKPLLALGLPVHVVHGNNLGDAMALHRMRDSGGLLVYHGADAELELGAAHSRPLSTARESPAATTTSSAARALARLRR